jgi:hypothetical protein
MVNGLSQYGVGIAFKQKCVRKYWTLTTMEQMETKEIHNNVIDLSDKIQNQYKEQSLKYKP